MNKCKSVRAFFIWVFLSTSLNCHAAGHKYVSTPPHILNMAKWVVNNEDLKERNFAIVDKKNAHIFLFTSNGTLQSHSPTLLGFKKGEVSWPDVGEHANTYVPLHERTTPAGRFEAFPGLNDKGEAVIWVNYDTAIAIHRLRRSPPEEQRKQRLSSTTPDDNRITWGCIVVSPEFFDQKVAPLMGRRPSVVYVLPEQRHWKSIFIKNNA